MLHDRLGWRGQPFFLDIVMKYIRSGITDDQDLKDSGKADKAAGKVKQGVEQAVDKVRDTVKKP
jgi:hypothetical protein